MADDATTTETDIAQAIVDILESTNSPAIQRAREVIAHRLALEGDVAPSRIPAPKNITEVGGYLNLLTEYGESAQRSRMIAAALGIAGPAISLPSAGTATVRTFVTRNQVRPAGPGQPTLPLSFTVRSDFAESLDAALRTLTNHGAAAPILAPIRTLPDLDTVLADGDAQLQAVGRRLTLAPTAALADPLTDSLSLSRPTAGGAFEVVARIFDPTAPEAQATPVEEWTSWACDTTTCQEVPTTDARIALTPLLNAAGWHQAVPPTDPVRSTEPGSWPEWRNITSLVPGRTTFGDELGALFTVDEILGSSVRDQLEHVWDGTAFAAP